MAFRRTAARVDRYVRDYGYWRDRQTPEQIAAEKAAAKVRTDAALAQLDQQPVGQRHEHQAITEPIYTTPFRVMRRVVSRDHGLVLEVIGETRSLGEALTIARTEQWAAIVIDRNSKQIHFNWQPELRRA